MAQAKLDRKWLKYYLQEGSSTHLNATAAAIKAGYKARSRHSFEQVGFQNRKKFEPKIAKWLDDHGFSEARLKTKVLELMAAKETVFQKLKGAVLQADLPEGHRIAATTGSVIETRDGHVFGDGDTLLEIDVENLGVQVKATDMALKVKGLYAAEKHELSGAVVTKIELSEPDRVLARKLIDQAAQKLVEARRAKPA